MGAGESIIIGVFVERLPSSTPSSVNDDGDDGGYLLQTDMGGKGGRTADLTVEESTSGRLVMGRVNSLGCRYLSVFLCMIHSFIHPSAPSELRPSPSIHPDVELTCLYVLDLVDHRNSGPASDSGQRRFTREFREVFRVRRLDPPLVSTELTRRTSQPGLECVRGRPSELLSQ